MYTYLLGFQYNTGQRSFAYSKPVTLDHPFSEDDIQVQQDIVAAEKNNGHQVWLMTVSEIVPSRKPK